MEFSNLTLQNKPSDLDNITLNEYVDQCIRKTYQLNPIKNQIQQPIQ